MGLVLELPSELEQELSAEASRAGLSLGEYVVQLLTAARSAAALPRTGADLVTYWQREELTGARPDITDSSAHARALRKQSETRTRS